MDTIELRGYLSIVLDMEKNILLRQKMIEELTKQAKPLGIPQQFKEPIMPKRYIPTVCSQKSVADANSETAPPSGCLVSVAIMLFYFLAVYLCMLSEAFFGGGFLLMCALPTLVLSILIGNFFEKKRSNYEAQKKIQKEQEEAERYRKEQAEREWREYLNARHIYNQHISDDRKRVLKERRKKNLLSQEMEELSQRQKDSEKRLSEIYAKNIIFPKYRNIVAVSSLYEYICAERCSSLEGHEGAYNIYEAEVRLNRIVTQLDQVIARLDAIQNNQFVLFTVVHEINQHCAHILQSVKDTNQRSMHILEATWNVADNIALQLDSINGQSDQITAQLQELQKTSALTAYHTARTQKELAYMNHMNYLAGRNDDVFWNNPPI